MKLEQALALIEVALDPDTVVWVVDLQEGPELEPWVEP